MQARLSVVKWIMFHQFKIFHIIKINTILIPPPLLLAADAAVSVFSQIPAQAHVSSLI